MRFFFKLGQCADAAATAFCSSIATKVKHEFAAKVKAKKEPQLVAKAASKVTRAA